MDFTVLFLMNLFLKERTSFFRLSMAAIIASFGSCLTIVIPMPVLIRFVFLYLIVSWIALKIAFSISSIKAMAGRLFLFFGTACFLDGVINAVYYHTDTDKFFREIREGTVFSEITLAYVLGGVGVVLVLAPFLQIAYGKIKRKLVLHRKVQISYDGKLVKGDALADTGNTLQDPISQEAVVVAEFSWIRTVFTTEEQLMLASYMKGNPPVQKGVQLEETSGLQKKIRMIPYHSLGQENGMLTAVRCDFLLIGEKSALKRVDNVLIGLYPGRLSAGKMYQVILHSSMVK